MRLLAVRMIGATSREKRIELLLEALAEERFVRRAFLSELVDELGGAIGTDGTDSQSEPLRSARLLLEKLNAGIPDEEYSKSIARLMELIRLPSPAGVDVRNRWT